VTVFGEAARTVARAARRQAFADSHGPDAPLLAWRFFRRRADPRQGAGRR
jgi:hypothetical protein